MSFHDTFTCSAHKKSTQVWDAYKCTCCLYGAQHMDLDGGVIHNEGRLKGWALKIKTFLGPETGTSTRNGFPPIQITTSSPI